MQNIPSSFLSTKSKGRRSEFYLISSKENPRDYKDKGIASRVIRIAIVNFFTIIYSLTRLWKWGDCVILSQHIRMLTLGLYNL